MSRQPIPLPGAAAVAVPLATGETVRVVNVHGSQVVDMFAFAAADPAEYLSMTHTRTSLKRLSPRTGDLLYTSRREPLLAITADTSPGVHDTLIAACDENRYRQLGHAGYHRSCAENLRNAMRELGVEQADIPAPLNLFMNIPWDLEGALDWLPTVSRPGDYVDLRAERDAIVVFSACPMDIVPINGPGLTPQDVRLEFP